MRVFVLSLLTALVLGASFPEPARAQRGITIAPGNGSALLTIGRQYLVVIAVGSYEQWPPLAGPVPDAREIKDILLSRYRIDRLHELYDGLATKANILRLLVRLQEELKADDSLLIYYAGHGHLDRSSSTGFWIPANAGKDDYEQQNWLPHTQLRGLLANFQTRHLCVISDSCFAGDLIQATRSLPGAAGPEYLQESYSHVCRQVLASGATQAVPDVSDFARQLKYVLGRNRSPYLDAFTLYNDLRAGVSGSMPLLGSLAGTGHQEGASFLLFLKPELVQPQEEPAPPAAGQERRPAAAKRNNFFSTAGGSGYAFPVAGVAGTLEGSPLLWVRAGYNICRDRGDWGIGLLAGALWPSTPESAAERYEILSFPLAVELRYQTPAPRALGLSAGLAAGAAFNRILFLDPAVRDISAAKPLLLSSLSVGLRVFRRFRITAGTRFLLILFDKNPFVGLSAEGGVEYAF